ncbi:class II D-tagatose-bisphosphate aldolase non-catalytic subunit [Shimia sp. MMG029]|uniref:class II D-tagatose-bisphosphate aldolase non-catalytic subunit n=1 Tax=Shimia sp. MMG029 TaxID=3021978 RepID=UPI0022FE8827|nr:class II D-tagatose-bisphosphate aldolase, non-catalytic subunit [Shimia sp. MMG029]MDA5556927.1 class II D-tagatose-bisphosphate aldolase, non-catalytic subunit [Shimia sp. MMG029]
MTDELRKIITLNRNGAPVAIPSVCTAHPDVLRASLALAERKDQQVVIEATSNQVNQDGGYTGITPEGFIRYVHDIADDAGVDRGRIIFGGDHLGPQAWRAMPAEAAMEKARVLVRDYVKAGFGKIHLDCSEGCAGEAAQLNDDQTASRSADLARICAEAGEDLLFVVGTEVPPPGGARMDEDGDIPPTDATDAAKTLAMHIETFGDLAPAIGGLVVQPGVEFSPTEVHHMPLARDPGFLAALKDYPNVCLEAHSTDYQHPEVFHRLAELGFAFQKVGPALTFAYREALYALDTLRGAKGALQAAMEEVMLETPKHWQGHYHGAEDALYQQRHFGLADRIRYYWPQPKAVAAVKALFDDLPSVIPDAALQTAFDEATLTRAEMLDGAQAQRLVDAQIELALEPYFLEVTS